MQQMGNNLTSNGVLLNSDDLRLVSLGQISLSVTLRCIKKGKVLKTGGIFYNSSLFIKETNLAHYFCEQ